MATISAPGEADFPALHLVAEASSREAQKSFKRLTFARLFSLVAATAIGVWAVAGTASRLIGIVAALLFLAALLLELYLWRLRPEQTWYEARAAAESAKTLGWRYAVGGEPFGKSSGSDVNAILHEQLHAVLGVLKNLDLSAEIGSGKAITDWMQDVRSAPLDARKAIYEEHRVRDQQSWYARRAKSHKSRLDGWTWALFSAEAAGLIGAALKISGVEEVDLLGLAAAVAASIAAWIQTNQYRTLHSAYVVTALELATLRDTVLEPSTEEEWSRFVEEAEKAFSREHTLWKASRGVQSLT